MSKFRIFDSDGHHITGRKEHGVLWPDMIKFASQVNKFSARPDDVFLCAYPRSGTHWTWELLMMLVHNELHLQQVSKMDAMLEYVGCEHLEAKLSPRVINTHLNYDQLPPDVFRKQCKIVLVCRNPKDVAVSLFNLIKSVKCYGYDGTFDAYVELFEKGDVPFGSWFDYVKQWDKALHTETRSPIFVVYYEQLIQNFWTTVTELGAFLGVSRSSEFYAEMKRLSKFDTFKKNKDACLSETILSLFKSEPGYIRKGIIGDWKNWFTGAQKRHFDEVCGRQLNGCSLTFFH